MTRASTSYPSFNDIPPQPTDLRPLHEYGEQDGLAYLVMAYVSGGTLGDEMEREGQLPLSKVVNYLAQLASALLDPEAYRGTLTE